MATVFQDLSFAIRSLRKCPGFAFAAVATLTIGLAANITVFTFVNGLLLRPLPFGDRTDRIVTLHSTHPLQPEDWQDAGLSYPDLTDVQRAARSFEGVAGFMLRNFTVTTDTDAERLLGESITPNLFPLLGVEPMLGRNFLPEEAAAPGLETSVILTHGLWQRRFGGDPSIIGRGVMINERLRTVVGVMPPGFKFPHRVELYLPLRGDEASRSSRNIATVAILEQGVSIEQAQSDISTIATQLQAQYPASNRDFNIRVLYFRDAYLGSGARPFSILLMSAVGFVLLIVCANLANLLLVRGAARQREMAVRAALGASRMRLVWAVLSESLMLSIGGSIAGVIAAAWLVDYLSNVTPEEMPYWFRIEIDGRVIAFTLLLTALTSISTGLIAALRASRPDVVGDLKEAARGMSLGRSAQRLQAVLAASQVALCLALLVGAHLTIQSFMARQRADLGFDDGPVLTMRVYLAGDRFDDPRSRALFFDNAAQALSTLPGVTSAAATSSIPGDDGGTPTRIVIDGRTAPGEEIAASSIPATTALFSTLGLKLIDGRTFTAEESRDPEARVTIVNQRLAQRLWPGASPIGRRIGLRAGDEFEWLRVIGVAPNVHYEEVGEATDQSEANFYVPYGMNASRLAAIMLRSEGDPRTLITSARDTLRRANAALPVWDVRTMDEVRRFTSWEQEFFGVMMGTFATAALLLACLGVYALLAYAARRRTHEIGVRLALGADANAVASLFFWQAMRIGLVGVVAGTVLALVLARGLSGMLFGVNTFDPLPYTGIAAALIVAVAAASYLPARRAARTDPMVALRAE